MTALRMLAPDRTGLVDQARCIREIVLSHGRYVWRLLRYLGVADRDLDDVCQEVFTTVHRKLGDVTDEGLQPWLRSICVNHAKNYRRRAHRHREMLVDEMPETVVSASQEEGLVLAQAQALLLALLDRLDEDWRAIFVLHTVEELPMEQVAKIVGCPLSTAYFRYRRACAGLENALVNT